MSTTKIHNVHFYVPTPRAIHCMALQEKTKKLAVARSDASIELWNLNNAYFIERSITSTLDNFSVEGLAWCDDRLFSVGLHGLLIEYNLFSLSIRSRSAVTGEAAMCLDVNRAKSHIAIGTEQGYLNIFKITEDGVTFEKFLDKQEGRIICLKYDSTGEFIASGSIDAIRIWNVKSGHALHKMSPGRLESRKETIVWCLAITDDFTIISGDSRGRLSFWDGKMGSQIESYQTHKADITGLCVSDDQESIYCAGVDPDIINYVKVKVGESKKWVKSVRRKIHQHDVRCLTLLGEKLFSGGTDGYLACSFHPPKTLVKLPPLLQSPTVSIGAESRYLLLQHTQHVEIWRLGNSETKDDSYSGHLDVVEEPKKLLVLQRFAKDWNDEDEKEGIICSCMSDDGTWLLVSSESGVALFQMDFSDIKDAKFLKTNKLGEFESPCVRAVFSANNKQFITAPINGGLQVYDILNDRASSSQKIQVKPDISDTITFLIISKCGKYLVAGDCVGNIVVLLNKKNQWEKHTKLPKYCIPPTAIALNKYNLIVAYADHKIIEYDIKKGKYSKYSSHLEKSISSHATRSKFYPIKNITFDARNDNIVILHDDSSIIVIDKSKTDLGSEAKLAKLDSSVSSTGKESAKSNRGVKTLDKYKHLLHIGALSNDELVVVEVNPLKLFEQLPPAFAQGTFGTK